MKLYFDNKILQFVTEKTETCECVFETYESSDRTGWLKGKNPDIEKGNIKLVINTNFWPDKVGCEWFHADIYKNGTLLLPLSVCYNEGKYFKPSYTINKNHDTFEWNSFLTEVCEICNYSDSWLIDELEKLLVKLPHDSTNIEDQIQVLKTIRLLDTTNNRFYKMKYRNYFDTLFFDAEIVKSLLDSIFIKNEKSSLELFDVVWNYIKDYAIDGIMNMG